MNATFPKEHELFLEALKLPPSEWGEFLAGACGDDHGLRQRLDNLLAAHREAGTLHRRTNEPSATTDHPTEQIGTLIGPYKLLEQIGEGGMGLVYMAEQQQPVRRLVALKLVKPGMDTKQVIARFEAERQALAMMDHQNIAKVHDAGTTETGRPYFVMELVRGIPLNEFCDQKHLTVRERLQLFIQVCQAVQHAHQKGIIHRDLKPTNVLITMDDTVPFPKVIDFGIAKALGQSLTDSTLHTGYAQLVGTPLYMSPEQAEMNLLGVDTRSDVYSLGVLLYELLTGSTPFDKETLTKASFDEMRRMIREDDPPRPSARISTLKAHALSTVSQRRKIDSRRISATLRGELDWIVIKALEKNRNRRYESASSLAADIQRYLSDESVLACPPTTMYRFQKFARKHKPALATAAAIAVCPILGTTVSAWQAVRATTAELQAQTNEQKAVANEQKANANAATAQEKEQEATKQRDEVKVLAERLQRTLYAANMNLAKNAWDVGGMVRLQDLLDQHRPKPGESDLRGFEWHYLHRLGHSELLTLNGHTGTVAGDRSVAFSPDGKRLAFGVGSTTFSGQDLKVWDAQTGQELVTCQGHSKTVWGVAYSPDGKRLASASADGTLRVWDAQTGKELVTCQGQTNGRNVAFSPDGKRLASASGWEQGEIKVWNAETGEELFTFKGHRGSVSSVTFSPDGKRLASASYDGTARIWNAETGEELYSLKGGEYSVAYSPEGKRLASASAGIVKVWDAESGQELASFKTHSRQINSLAFSPDGKRLASGWHDGTAKIWDAQTGHELFSFKGHTWWVNCVAFSPDGTRLASGSGDGTVKIWNANASQEARTIGEPTDRVRSIAFSPDGKRLVSGLGDKSVRVRDVQTGEELLALKAHTAPVNCVASSPDGKRLASGSSDKTVKIWDAVSGQELVTCTGHTSIVISVAFSPDSTRLASSSSVLGSSSNGDKGEPGEVLVWDAKTGRELFNLKGHSRFVDSVVFSPDGKWLATASRDNTIKVWNAETGQEVITLTNANSHRGGVLGIQPGRQVDRKW